MFGVKEKKVGLQRNPLEQIEKNEKWLRRFYIGFGVFAVLLTFFSIFYLGMK